MAESSELFALLKQREQERVDAVNKALDGPHGDNATLYANTKALFDAATFPTWEQFGNRVMYRFLQGREDAGLPSPNYEICIRMMGAAAALYHEERFDTLPPNPALYSSHNNTHIIGQMRELLLRQQRKLMLPEQTLEILYETLGKCFSAITERLPPLAYELPDGSQFPFLTVPLFDALDDIPTIIQELCDTFFSPEVVEAELFFKLRQTIPHNRDHLPVKASMRETLAAFLKDTHLQDIFLEPLISFAIPEETRFSGHWIIAPPGRGKTTLLHALIKHDLDKDASVVLIDSKGDLIEPIKSLSAIKDRLILIEPDPDTAFALNPLDASHTNVAHIVGLIEYIMAGLLDAKFTGLQSTLFRNVVPAIIEAIPNPTLDDFKQVMVKGLPSLAGVSAHSRQFFEDRETGFYSKTYDSTRKEVVWRLDYLMSNPTLRSMFSASHTKLDMGKEMDAGKVIIINNSKAVLGDEGAEFFGRFFIALIARAAQQRSGKATTSKKACYVYIDECQSVIAKDTRIPVLLDECRSQRIALILSHQRTAQLTPPVLDAVANCAIRMANSDDEAKYLSTKLRMDTEVLQGLPRGTFGTFVRDLTPRGVQLEVSKVDLDSLPKMSADEVKVIRDRMKADFSASPSAPKPADEPSTGPAPAPPASERAASPAAQPQPTDSSTVTDPGEPSGSW